VAGVDEGVQARFCQKAGPAGGDVAAELRQHALRQSVGFDLVGEGHGGEAWAVVEPAADHALGEARFGQNVEAGFLPVADRDDADERETLGAPCFPVAPGQGLYKSLRHRMPAARAADQHAIAGLDQPGRRIGGNDLDHRSSRVPERLPSGVSP
jgi:hypothetical protein